MGVAERREREREQLRSRIIDAARDLLLEQGLSGLSMRAIAERIEYSPATIYIYFRDKDELIRDVVQTGFELLGGMVSGELAALRESGSGLDEYGAVGRAYARFAVENPTYFRVMFELPGTAQLRCEEAEAGSSAEPREKESSVDALLALLRRHGWALRLEPQEAKCRTLMAWGLIHGLTTLYLAGQLTAEAETPDAFMELIDRVLRSFRDGWKPSGPGVEAF